MLTYRMPEDEAKLIRLAMEGNKEAIEILCSYYRKRIKGRLRTMVSDSDLEDIVEDVLLEVLKNIHKYDPAKGSLATFIYLQVRTVLHRYWAANRDGMAMELDEDEPDPARPPYENLILHLCMLKQIYAANSVSAAAPHILAWHFSRCLEYRPSEIVIELSQIPLRDLSERAIEEYESISGISFYVLGHAFAPLDAKLAATVTLPLEQIPGFPVSVGRTLTGETVFENHYGENPAGEISTWKHRVNELKDKYVQNHYPECVNAPV